MMDTNPNLRHAAQITDPDQVTRLLDLELEQKRAEWKKKSARSRAIRMQSFVALFFLLAGCVLVYHFMASQLKDARSMRQPSAQQIEK